MNEKEKIIAKIKESAYDKVNKKIEEERKRIENKINNELKDVERCLQYIKNKMVFKIVERSYSKMEYVLADENTFFEDYNKEPEYGWNKGIKFCDPSRKPYEPLFKVNNESYYDMRYILRHYEETFNKYRERILCLYEKFHTIENLASDLIKQEPKIKKFIEEYKQVEIDEAWLEELRGEEID